MRHFLNDDVHHRLNAEVAYLSQTSPVVVSSYLECPWVGMMESFSNTYVLRNGVSPPLQKKRLKITFTFSTTWLFSTIGCVNLRF